MFLLSAGHFPQAKGAEYNGIYEHDVAKDWVFTLASLFAERRRAVSIVPTGPLTNKVAWINNSAGLASDLALEIHFNSDASKKASGSETLYCPGSVRGLRFAQVIQTALGAVCAPNRGVKEGWYRMEKPDHQGDPQSPDKVVDYFLRATKCTAIIIEPEFIYNYNVVTAVQHAACAAIVDSVISEVDRENDQ